MRSTDVVGRLGGEEFVAILPGNAAEAAMVAERVRVAFEHAGVEIAGHAIGATASIGVACATAPVTIDQLLARADAALYRAKRNGRNRIELADSGAAPELAPAPDPDLGQVVVALR
jgi:diguanylate cyclase (GGDEF)-like protein